MLFATACLFLSSMNRNNTVGCRGRALPLRTGGASGTRGLYNLYDTCLKKPTWCIGALWACRAEHHSSAQCCRRCRLRPLAVCCPLAALRLPAAFHLPVTCPSAHTCTHPCIHLLDPLRMLLLTCTALLSALCLQPAHPVWHASSAGAAGRHCTAVPSVRRRQACHPPQGHHRPSLY